MGTRAPAWLREALNRVLSDNGIKTGLSSINATQCHYKFRLWTRTPLVGTFHLSCISCHPTSEWRELLGKTAQLRNNRTSGDTPQFGILEYLNARQLALEACERIPVREAFTNVLWWRNDNTDQIV
jgi:hypothetical protein